MTKATFKFRIKWSRAADQWNLEVEHRSYGPSFVELVEPEFSRGEIMLGFRASYRSDIKKTFWVTVSSSPNPAVLKVCAEAYAQEQLAAIRRSLEAEARAKAHSEVTKFEITLDV